MIRNGDLVLIRDQESAAHYFGFLIKKDLNIVDLAIPIIDRAGNEGIPIYRLGYQTCMRIDLDYIFNCSINQYVLAWFQKNLRNIEQGLTSNHLIVREWAKMNL